MSNHLSDINPGPGHQRLAGVLQAIFIVNCPSPQIKTGGKIFAYRAKNIIYAKNYPVITPVPYHNSYFPFIL